MARGAIARLYDVDEHTVAFKRLRLTNKYDQATVHFRARKGKLIDLDQMLESVWATRLSGGTRSGLVQLDVTAIGSIEKDGDKLFLKVAGSDKRFPIVRHSDDEKKSVFDRLLSANSQGQTISLNGQLEGWSGRWPDFLKRVPPEKRLMVTNFEIVEKP